MTGKRLFAVSIAVVLLVALFGTVGAQGETPTETPTPTTEVGSLPTITPFPTETPVATATLAPPTTVPTVGPETPGYKFFQHPIVKLLDAYFGKTPVPTVTATPDPLATPDPNATPTPLPVDNGSGLTAVGEEIAAYHEDGLGFGELVKIYAMVKASEEACAAQQAAELTTGTTTPEPCVPLTAVDLVDKVQSGAGMGQLFKEYGKPALLGVGHVRKEVKNQDKAAPAPTVNPTEGTTVDQQSGQGQDKGKDDKQTGKPEDKGGKPEDKATPPAKDKSQNKDKSDKGNGKGNK